MQTESEKERIKKAREQHEKELQWLKGKRHSTVVKANELITHSRFALSTQQQKIVLFLISQIKQSDDDFKEYDFSIREFCEICGIETDSGRNYEMLKEQIKAIADKSMWCRIDNGTTTLLRWIEKPYIDENNGTIRIRLDKDMKPYLLQLQENFTQYELQYTLRFKSKYTIRLYEYIQSVHFQKQKEYVHLVDLETLKMRMGADNYTEFKSFHTRALKIAVKEINEVSDKIVSYVLKRRSRNVVAVEFTISTKDSIAIFKDTMYHEYTMHGENPDNFFVPFDKNQISLFDDDPKGGEEK